MSSSSIGLRMSPSLESFCKYNACCVMLRSYETDFDPGEKSLRMVTNYLKISNLDA